MLINFSGELEQKGQIDSCCRMLEDNIEIDINMVWGRVSLIYVPQVGYICHIL